MALIVKPRILGFIILLFMLYWNVPASSGSSVSLVEFAGSRPAGPEDACVIPLPQDRPPDASAYDSLLVAPEASPNQTPSTQYDLFEVDLDGDGSMETIAQVVRFFRSRGSYARAWWGIYGQQGLEQVLFWSYDEETRRLQEAELPDPPKDRADSLTIASNVPTFLPAYDVFNCGDLTGDGRPETAILGVARRGMAHTFNGMIVAVILSPAGEELHQVFRANLLFLQCRRPHVERMEHKAGRVSSFRLRQHKPVPEGPSDLVLEPWSPAQADSLCALLWLHEQSLPLDPEDWIPSDAIPAETKIPDDWYYARWEGSRFGAFRLTGENGGRP